MGSFMRLFEAVDQQLDSVQTENVKEIIKLFDNLIVASFVSQFSKKLDQVTVLKKVSPGKNVLFATVHRKDEVHAVQNVSDRPSWV